MSSLENGESLVSFGLLTQLLLEDGKATVSVSGPSWTRADKLILFQNGKAIKEISIPKEKGILPDEKFKKTFSNLSLVKGDFFVAVASGPGVTDLFWAYNPPYQATSPVYQPYVMGISSARFVK